MVDRAVPGSPVWSSCVVDTFSHTHDTVEVIIILKLGDCRTLAMWWFSRHGCQTQTINLLYFRHILRPFVRHFRYFRSREPNLLRPVCEQSTNSIHRWFM